MKIMEKTAAKLGLTAQGLSNGQNMELLMQDKHNLMSTLGGVQFEESLSGDVDLPRYLFVAIRLPGELRQKNNQTIEDASKMSTWNTDKLFPPNEIAGPRDDTLKFSAFPSKIFVVFSGNNFFNCLF